MKISVPSLKKNGLLSKEKTKKNEIQVTVDHPNEGETITAKSYSIRISGAPEIGTEISINSGPWQACRPSVGYHWFDWSPKAGPASIVVRYKDGDKTKQLAPRHVTVS